MAVRFINGTYGIGAGVSVVGFGINSSNVRKYCELESSMNYNVLELDCLLNPYCYFSCMGDTALEPNELNCRVSKKTRGVTWKPQSRKLKRNL